MSGVTHSSCIEERRKKKKCEIVAIFIPVTEFNIVFQCYLFSQYKSSLIDHMVMIIMNYKFHNII